MTKAPDRDIIEQARARGATLSQVATRHPNIDPAYVVTVWHDMDAAAQEPAPVLSTVCGDCGQECWNGPGLSSHRRQKHNTAEAVA